MIPEAKIEEVRQRVDMIALVQRHGVDLKKSGRSFKGRCPFHNEKTPSFYVWAEEKRFKCFGCDAGGDAITFVMRLFGKTFVDTVRDLAKEVGVDLEAMEDPTLRDKQQIKDATDFSQEHFKKQLWDPVVGKRAREYLLSRGVTEDVARQFGLGWTPMVWTDLADKLRESGLLQFAEKAGLVSPRKSGDGFYDMFRGRLMIPIRSPEGRTIAFGGRLLEGDDGPKYLNSRESKLYNKSETLYGLDVARDEIRKRKQAVLVEGYFDCIGLHQAGVRQAVALCSTALTPGHMAALKRAEAKELVLLLDGDNAGRNAVERLAGPILAAGAAAKVAVLPEGEDPDTYARKAGPASVQMLIDQALPLTTYLFKTLLPNAASSSFEEKMLALDRLRPVAQVLPVGLMRSAFFGAMSAHMGLPASELEAQLRGKEVKVQAVQKPAAAAGPADKAPEAWEAWFAAAVLRDKRLLVKDVWRVGDELKHKGLRSLVQLVGGGQSPEDALYEASDAVKQALSKVQLPVPEDALEQAFSTLCQRMKLKGVDEQLRAIARELSQLDGRGELNEASRELLGQQGQLLGLKRQILAAQKNMPQKLSFSEDLG